MTGRPLHLVVGPQRHGVVSFALALADSLTRRGHPAPVLRVEDWAGLDGAIGHPGGVHVNFTDRRVDQRMPAEGAQPGR